MDWYSVLVQVVEDETAESLQCTIRGRTFWIPKAAISSETRCVLGECDVMVDIQRSLASDLGLFQILKPNCDPCRPEARAQKLLGAESVGGAAP